MTRYLLSIYQPDDVAPPENLDEIMRDMAAVNDEIRAAGSWVFTAGLHPPATATVVRGAAHDLVITDGPYIEGKEHIGGFTVIRAEDLDAALVWAGKVAAVVAPLAIEVRPLVDE